MKIREANRAYLMSLPTPNNVSKLDCSPHSPALDLNHFSIFKMNTKPTETKLSFRIKDLPPTSLFKSMYRSVPRNTFKEIIMRVNSLGPQVTCSPLREFSLFGCKNSDIFTLYFTSYVVAVSFPEYSVTLVTHFLHYSVWQIYFLLKKIDRG